jgi:cytochrome c553
MKSRKNNLITRITIVFAEGRLGMGTYEIGRRSFAFGVTLVFLFSMFATASIVATSCTTCHGNGVLDAIYNDWNNSKHAQVPVTCQDCHGADPTDVDAISHNGYDISVIVSPDDCAVCHDQEAQEFEQSLHSLGAKYYEYLFGKQVLPYLESLIEGGYIIRENENITHAATLRGCQSCHGTNMTGKSTDDYTVWPNNGIGRINPDGSMGSCAACHTRHTFSIAEARHPETCGQCHMGPDHPQIEMFMESKHGNIYSAEGDSWNWDVKDWVAGVDYRAPTCASCHMSGSPGAPKTHDVSARLSWELEPAVSRHTDNIANSLGIGFSDGTDWEVKRDRMKAVCNQCHSTTWVDNYYEQADIAVELYAEQYAYVKGILDDLYADGLITPEPFDEPIEFKFYEFWHHEGRRARMAAFMQAPDYVQWHGFYELLRDREEIEHMAEEIRRLASEPEETSADVDFLLIALGVFMLVELVIIAFLSARKDRVEMPPGES